MDLLSVAREFREIALRNIQGFFLDTKRLWNASPIITVSILGSGLVRGLGVALVFQQIGNFIDAAIGARGVGVVTSELRSDLWQMLVVIFLVFAAHVFSRRLRGLALSLADRISNVILPTSLFAVAYGMLESSVMLMALLWALRSFLRQSWIVGTLSACIAALAFIMIQDVLVFAATRTLTVGSMLTIGGAGLYLGLWWAARPYREKLN